MLKQSFHSDAPTRIELSWHHRSNLQKDVLWVWTARRKKGECVSTRLNGCMWTWKFCLTAYKGFLKIWRSTCQIWVTTPPGLATTRTHQVFWKSWLGSGRLGSMLQVWSDVDSKETSAGVRSGCVWVRASVPLWACWWHHKPLNQCFTAPRHSGGLSFFNK